MTNRRHDADDAHIRKRQGNGKTIKKQPPFLLLVIIVVIIVRTKEANQLHHLHNSFLVDATRKKQETAGTGFL